MHDCLFCKIIAGTVPATKVYEDGSVLAIRDINPLADTHVLVMPKIHIEKAGDLTFETAPLAGHCMSAIAEIARNEGIEDYCVVVNSGAKAGQSVPHLHFHLLSPFNSQERLLYR
ncbi:MAG: histidine triad nucleotide-binding protein [Oscillospiraceae bacterium]|jgi:histidine triad (HIT) family protein|nr:histidine triad nucleotide-binding protein [Oscillospiraceae bacterium]